MQFIVFSFFSIIAVLAIIFAAPFNWAVYTLAALVVGFSLIITNNPKRLLLILLTLSIQVGVDFQLMYRGDTRLGGPGGISISLTFIIVLCILALWVAEFPTHKVPPLNFFRDTSLPALFLIGAGIISMINTANKFLSVCAIFQLIKVFLLYFVVANIVRNKKDLKLCVTMMLVCLLTQSVLYIVQNTTGVMFDPTGRIHAGGTGGGILRLGGTFGTTPGMMAMFFAAFLPIALSVFVMQKNFRMRILAGAACLTGMPALVLTFCRSPWVSVAICTLAFLGFAHKRGWLNLRTIVFSLATASILILFFLPVLSTRFEADYLSDSWDTRMNLNKLAWNMIESKPVIGVGINSFHDVKRSYLSSDIQNNWIHVVHNQYLLIWAEMGTVGIVAFLWFLIAAYKKGIASTRSSDVLLAALSLGITLSFLSMLLNMTLNIFGAEPLNNLLWFVVGLISATWRLSDDQK